MTSPSPRLSVRIAALLFSLLVALLAAEAGLRVLRISYPRWLQNDDLLGSVHRPGVSFHQKDEGDAIVRFNKAGFRDRERTLAKPPGTVRIAVLGDSYVEAGQVDGDSTLTSVMEKELNSCRAFGDHPVEVLNFGVTGYGTAQEYLLLKSKVWAYSPDIVIVAFLTGNDFRNNTARLHRDQGRPYYVYKDSTLVYDGSFRERYSTLGAVKRDVGHVLLDASRVAQVVYRVGSQMKKRRAASARKSTADTQGVELGLDDQIYLPPTDPAWQEAWKITEELLRMTRDEVAAHNARLLVVTLSNALQVDPDPVKRYAVMQKLGTTTLFYPDKRLHDWGEKENISVLNLAPFMQTWAEAHKKVLHGFKQNPGTGHWNVEGHRVGGQMIARWIAGVWEGVSCPGEP